MLLQPLVLHSLCVISLSWNPKVPATLELITVMDIKARQTFFCVKQPLS